MTINIVSDKYINREYKDYVENYIFNGKDVNWMDPSPFINEVIKHINKLSGSPEETLKILLTRSFQVYDKIMGNILSEIHKKKPELYDLYSEIKHETRFALFTGGADVSPYLYKEKKGTYTHTSMERDLYETCLYAMLNKNVFKLGICRGSQFLTVISKGKLIQDVNNHGMDHKIEFNESISRWQGKKALILPMTSTHHQMMYPFNLDKTQYELIAWSEFFRSNTYTNGNNEEIELDPKFLESEIVYYKNTNSLCIQGHPEYGHCNNLTKEIIGRIINLYIRGYGKLNQKERDNFSKKKEVPLNF